MTSIRTFKNYGEVGGKGRESCGQNVELEARRERERSRAGVDVEKVRTQVGMSLGCRGRIESWSRVHSSCMVDGTSAPLSWRLSL